MTEKHAVEVCIEGHTYPQKVYKPEFDKLCARVEALEQKVSPTAEEERRRIVAWLRLESSYQNRPWNVIATDIERGEHWHDL